MKTKKIARIEFKCTLEEKKAIEELAKYLEMPTGTLIRNLTLSSYEDAIIFKKLGLLKGIKTYKTFKEKYSEMLLPALPGFE